MGETQEFGRWGRSAPAQEFGWTKPQVMPQQFGGRIPFVDQGSRSPRREVPPSNSRKFLN